MASTLKRDHYLRKYLSSIQGTGMDSEIALYTPIQNHLIKGLLEYDLNTEVSINKRGEVGIPDIRIYSPIDGTPWIVWEVKLDDDEIRNDEKRNRIWQRQIVDKRYIKPTTEYVVLSAPYTIYILNREGQILNGIHIVAEDELMAKSGAISLIESSDKFLSATDHQWRLQLKQITRETALTAPHYTAFRNGDYSGGYIPLSKDNLGDFSEVVQQGVNDLTIYCTREFKRLKKSFQDINSRLENLQERFELFEQFVSDETELRLWRTKIRQFENRHSDLLKLFQEDYPAFAHDQAYTGDAAARHTEELFISNTAYVAMSRLIFVRICEDSGLTTHKISHKGVSLWRNFVDSLKDRYQVLLDLAFRDVEHIYHRLFEEKVFDWLGRGNSTLHVILERIMFQLNAFDFSSIERDLLGDIYQTIRPKEDRKRLGEFYTDEEVVDFILYEAGISEDAEIMQKRILDPSCGSFTFGIRALRHIRDRGQHLSPENRIELGQRCLHGWDINPFSVFLSHLSILFGFMDTFLEIKKQKPDYHLEGFSITHCNSLLISPTSQLAPGVTEDEEENSLEDLDLHMDALNGDIKQGFDYIIGNPPYVRNERIPREDRMLLDTYFEKIRSHNTDLSAYFVYSAFTKWLVPGGKFGMVLPMGLLNGAMAAKLRNELKKFKIDKIVSLEWMATQLFEGTDIVPILLFGRAEPPDDDHEVTIVTGLSEKEQLSHWIDSSELREEHSSRVSWNQYHTVSPEGNWSTEISGRDIAILEKLNQCERLGDHAISTFGVKQGSGRPFEISGEIQPDQLRWLRGQHVCSYFSDEPDEYVDVDDVNKHASDNSIWKYVDFFRDNAEKQRDANGNLADLVFRPAMRQLFEERGGLPSDNLVVAVAEVAPTMNAAVLNPLKACVNNSVVLIIPTNLNSYAISGIVNSITSRYYALLLLRSAVLLRRRAHWYPRTINSLPMPILSEDNSILLQQLSREAHEISDNQSRSVLEYFMKKLISMKKEKACFMGLKAVGIGKVKYSDFCMYDDTRLERNYDNLTISIPDADFYELLKVAFSVFGSDQWNVDDFQNVLLPASPEDRTKLAAAIRNFDHDLEQTKEKMAALQEQMDEIIAEGCGLTAAEYETIRNRCQEFPLNVTVGAPRYVWSEDRKVQAQRFYDQGIRFK